MPMESCLASLVLLLDGSIDALTRVLNIGKVWPFLVAGHSHLRPVLKIGTEQVPTLDKIKDKGKTSTFPLPGNLIDLISIGRSIIGCKKTE